MLPFSSASLHLKLDGKRITSPLYQQLPSMTPVRRRAVFACTSAQFSDTNVEDVVIVGGGIAGMATALALHKLGVKSRVLEQSPTLRIAGAALAVWTNGWHALEALGLAASLRGNFLQISGFQFLTTEDKCLADLKFSTGKEPVELRAVDRRMLLETLVNALPPGTVTYDSRVSKLHKGEGRYPRVELTNGSTLQAKVIVGCDGIGSVVARDLGFEEAHYAGYIGIRGVAMFPDGHSFSSVLKQMLGRGVRLGCIPLDSNRVFWFLVFNRPPGTKIADTSLIKQEALKLVNGWPEASVDVIKRTPPETLSRSAISDRWMWPWTLSKLHRDGVSFAGDAMHPVTPNLAQGGCSALEDGVVLARELSKTFKDAAGKTLSINEEMQRIEAALEEYTKQRQQRMFSVAVQANMIGRILQVEDDLVCSVRNNLLPGILTVDTFVQHSIYNVGALV